MPEFINIHLSETETRCMPFQSEPALTLETFLQSLRSRGIYEEGSVLKYAYKSNRFDIKDDVDFQVFLKRILTEDKDADIFIDSPSVPPQFIAPSSASLQRSPSQNSLRPVSHRTRRQPSVNNTPSAAHIADVMSDGQPMIPAYRVAFESFHQSKGVKVVTGTLGTIHNVRMRWAPDLFEKVYISRAFAIRHGFIPADTKLGHFAYNGLVSLGSWPVQIGAHVVQQQIMLGEVADGAGGEGGWEAVVGKSYAEKRLAKADSMDATIIRFGDSQEEIKCDVVMVKDNAGRVINL